MWDWCMRRLSEEADRIAMNFDAHDFTGEDEMQYKN